MGQPKAGRGEWATGWMSRVYPQRRPRSSFMPAAGFSYDKDLQADCQGRGAALEERRCRPRHYGRAGDVLRRQGLLDGLQG